MKREGRREGGKGIQALDATAKHLDWGVFLVLGLVSLKHTPVKWKAEQGLDIQIKVPYLECIVDALMGLGNWIVSIDDEGFFSTFYLFNLNFLSILFCPPPHSQEKKKKGRRRFTFSFELIQEGTETLGDFFW